MMLVSVLVLLVLLLLVPLLLRLLPAVAKAAALLLHKMQAPYMSSNLFIIFLSRFLVILDVVF